MTICSKEISVANVMIQVVEQCLRLDSYATRIYQLLAFNAQKSRLERFWRQIADQNEQHVVFWNQLRTWANNGLFLNLFEDSYKVLEKLKNLESKIKKLSGRCEGIHTMEKAFALAFKLEFYLLHPAFETLFQYYHTLTEEVSAVTPYDRHINTLFEALYENDLVTLELELLGETIHRLWQENRKMAVLSNTDELTGVLNRRGLFNAMNHLGHLAQRNNNTVGVLMIDIDHFKQVNDAHGHQKGDEVLKRVATTIKQSIRASDALGRYGGEEFVVFLTVVEADALNAVGDKIRHSVASGGGGVLPDVTISIGGACAKVDKTVDQGIQKLIQLADENLLRAKRSGRNRICI